MAVLLSGRSKTAEAPVLSVVLQPSAPYGSGKLKLALRYIRSPSCAYTPQSFPSSLILHIFSQPSPIFLFHPQIMGLLELDVAWTAPSNWLYVLTSAVVVFFLVDHLNTLRKRKSLPGPAFAWPIIGAIVEMVLDPTNFWNRQEDYGPLSWNSIAGKFMVFSRDTDSSIKIFKSNSPEELKIVLHPNAVRLLGEDNIAFMQGAAHKELRKRLLPLFTKKALGVYLDIQVKAIREHLAQVTSPPTSLPTP